MEDKSDEIIIASFENELRELWREHENYATSRNYYESLRRKVRKRITFLEEHDPRQMEMKL